MAIKKINRKGRTPRQPKPMSFDQLREKFNALLEDVFRAQYMEDGSLDEATDVLDALDERESEDEVRAFITHQRDDLADIIKQLTKQTTAAQNALALLDDPHNVNRIISEWQMGQVQCPRCDHVFKAEDHTL
jgi:hypothetical protein